MHGRASWRLTDRGRLQHLCFARSLPLDGVCISLTVAFVTRQTVSVRSQLPYCLTTAESGPRRARRNVMRGNARLSVPAARMCAPAQPHAAAALRWPAPIWFVLYGQPPRKCSATSVANKSDDIELMRQVLAQAHQRQWSSYCSSFLTSAQQCGVWDSCTGIIMSQSLQPPVLLALRTADCRKLCVDIHSIYCTQNGGAPTSAFSSIALAPRSDATGPAKGAGACDVNDTCRARKVDYLWRTFSSLAASGHNKLCYLNVGTLQAPAGQHYSV